MIIMQSKRLALLAAAATVATPLGILATTGGASAGTQQHCRVTVTYTVVGGQVFTGWQQHHCPGITNGRVRQLERLGGNPPGFRLRQLPSQHGTWQVSVWGRQPGVDHLRNPSSCLIDGAGGAFGS